MSNVLIDAGKAGLRFFVAVEKLFDDAKIIQDPQARVAAKVAIVAALVGIVIAVTSKTLIITAIVGGSAAYGYFNHDQVNGWLKKMAEIAAKEGGAEEGPAMDRKPESREGGYPFARSASSDTVGAASGGRPKGVPSDARKVF